MGSWPTTGIAVLATALCCLATEDTRRLKFSECLDTRGDNIYGHNATELVSGNSIQMSGYTYQYKQLNALVRSFPHLKILAFPCHQFGHQEPGNESEILAGLKHVRPGGGFRPRFPLTSKTEVNGENEAPLYSFLKRSCPPTTDVIGNSSNLYFSPIKVTDVTWNFEKFLVDASGVPRFRFHPSVEPTEIVDFIEGLLFERARNQ
ncbi:hypothetical protein CAPTEDRAFT_229325 [Capitella teleta]|uniref:Glutathione peroxidase n=1 Tax=Capitella teleta TaxID=283909 RepID=R7VJJ7_CAPTE|nr:hypothetical protein CAPTEDRAFT_229325 [Capitella teleta]|eukprot:ELU18767.1 hypothetical protein CAPTEDRAFT_229325 [Capitella teleta]